MTLKIGRPGGASENDLWNPDETKVKRNQIAIFEATRLRIAINSRIRNGTVLYNGLFHDKCPPKKSNQ